MRNHLLTTVSAGVLVLFSGKADATITEVIGGPGGADFSLRCPKGSVAVGVAAHAGAWVDGVTLLCSTSRRGKRQETGWVGSTHSTIQEVYCPRQGVARGLKFTFTQGNGLEREYVNSIGVECDNATATETADQSCIDTGEGCRSFYAEKERVGINDLELRLTDSVWCPEDELLIGINGRADKAVRAIGAVCGPRPGVIAAGSLSRSPAGAAQAAPGVSDKVGDQLGGPKAATELPAPPSRGTSEEVHLPPLRSVPQ